MTGEELRITVSLDAETVAHLDQLAKVEERDRSFMIKKAVTNFVQLHRWQNEEIEKGVKQGDAGFFLSDEEISALMDGLGQFRRRLRPAGRQHTRA